MLLRDFSKYARGRPLKKLENHYVALVPTKAKFTPSNIIHKCIIEEYWREFTKLPSLPPCLTGLMGGLIIMTLLHLHA